MKKFNAISALLPCLSLFFLAACSGSANLDTISNIENHSTVEAATTQNGPVERPPMASDMDPTTGCECPAPGDTELKEIPEICVEVCANLPRPFERVTGNHDIPQIIHPTVIIPDNTLSGAVRVDNTIHLSPVHIEELGPLQVKEASPHRIDFKSDDDDD